MHRRLLLALLVALGFLVAPRGGHADDPPAEPPAEPPKEEAPLPRPGEPGFEPTRIPTPVDGRASLYAEVDLSTVGDAKTRIEIHFSEANYAALRKNVTDPRKFLQDMRPGRSASEIAPDASASFVDKAHAVVLLMTELGAVRGSGECGWILNIGGGYEMIGTDTVEGRPRGFFEEKGTWGNGMAFVGRYTYLLPKDAKDSNWDSSAQALTWTLPCDAGSGPARLGMNLKVKDRLMTSVYKIYGLGGAMASQWVAKLVIRNNGTSRVRNLRVRFRLDRYSEWSGWSKYPEVVPGQTVVALYNPVLDAAIARIKSNTPADLHIAWSYEDAAGKKEEDEDTARMVLLGVNEFVFSNLVKGESFGTWAEDFNNAPLLAAWVSRNDSVVKQFAAMANRMAGGVGAATDDASAVKVLEACYDLLRANDFTYQHPPALVDKTVSFDVRQVQNVKFPRDTIRDRSGTCIDLAILFAAMVNALGLEPHLALIPGHCFPVVRLPGGNLVAVEATGVGGGLRFGSAGFQDMFQKGIEELEAATADGRLYLIDVREGWTSGIANPEVDELAADILERWGIKETGRGEPAPDAAPGGGDAVVGVFTGQILEKQADGSTRSYPVAIGIDRAAGAGRFTGAIRVDVEVHNAGNTVTVILLEEFEAVQKGELVTGRCTKRTVKNTATGASEERTTSNQIVFRSQGGKLVGKFGSDAEGWSTFTLPRKPR